jgi:hypothetical protein
VTKPTIICVLGMHRSGTSLVAQLLHALDLDLGPEAHLMGPSEDNPAGHWENEPIADLNDEILDRLGGTWWEPPELPPGWERASELADLRREARKLIDEDFAGRQRWGFKDPRICLTLPLWQTVLPPMRYVICLRNPVDVAWSLKARRSEPVPFEEGAELWLRYMRSALAGTAGEPQLIVFYEDLMADPKRVVRRLARFIGNRKSAAGKAYARAALRVARRPGLWHHQTPLANVIDEPRLLFEVKALYLALRLFAPGTRSVDSEVLGLFSAHAIDAGRQRADIETRIADRRAELER